MRLQGRGSRTGDAAVAWWSVGPVALVGKGSVFHFLSRPTRLSEHGAQLQML